VSDLKPGAPGDWVLTAREQVERMDSRIENLGRLASERLDDQGEMREAIALLEKKVQILTKMAFLAWHSSIPSAVDASMWEKYRKAAEELGAFDSSKDILKD
jgi:hypothetical protein